MLYRTDTANAIVFETLRNKVKQVIIGVLHCVQLTVSVLHIISFCCQLKCKIKLKLSYT